MTTPAKPTGPSRTEQRLKDTIRKAKGGTTEPAESAAVPAAPDASATSQSPTPRKRAASAAAAKPVDAALAPASKAGPPDPFSHSDRRGGRVWPD
jgi:hypothetical protein